MKKRSPLVYLMVVIGLALLGAILVILFLIFRGPGQSVVTFGESNWRVALPKLGQVFTLPDFKKSNHQPVALVGQPVKILKDVGEPSLENFGLTDQDFEMIAESGFEVIESNFDLCASEDEVLYFLDQSHQHGLKVILNAGSGEAEWGYACDEEYSPGQRPRWQESLVSLWVNRWKNHPALFAWDIANEAGGNFPNAEDRSIRVTLSQLKEASQSVRAVDPGHPIMIRMNGWFFYDEVDDFFGLENPFGQGVADLVMINAYSNVEDYYPDFIETVMGRATTSILEVDPKVKIIGAIGAWEEPPLWYRPSSEQLSNDLEQMGKVINLYGIAFFKYGARESQWFWPDSEQGDARLWQLVSKYLTS
ncbi:hypothetical protein ACFL0Y_02455 [Patescibacteria group bacterium]